MKEDATILDLGGYQETYCDEVAETQIRGPNAAVIMTRWKKVDHVWRRVIVDVAIKPVLSLSTDSAKISTAVAAALAERILQ